MSRLATLPAWPARALLALVAALAIWGALMPQGAGPRLGPAATSDTALYRAIADRTARDGYYRAAVTEQRRRGYPLRPFPTVREPLLAWTSAWLGAVATLWLLRALVAATLAAMLWRLRGGGLEAIAALLLATLSIAMFADPVLALWHETWAALLVALAIAVRRDRLWWPACLIGLAAMLVRELAVPAIVAMLVCAIAERRRGEAIGWAAALTALAVALALHAMQVAALVRPDDLASPGWTRFGGWSFVVAIARGTSALAALPAPLAGALVPVALLGWVSRADAFGRRVALALGLTIAPFMAIGRPDNFYWGVMLAPLLPIGLAFAPRALADLVRAARQAGALSPSVRPCTADASS